MPRRSALGWTRIALFLAALSACQELSAPSSVPISPLIRDAIHGDGKPHFYFLSPMVAAPAVSGGFDANLAPQVRICALTGSSCGSVLATYTTETGPGSETVRVDPAAEHYIVNWHTDQFALDPAVTYQIRVLVGAVELGFADVDVVNSGRELRNVNTGEYVPLVDGRTLPIKFRVEGGFLAAIAVVPVTASAGVSETQQFQAVLTDLHGAPLSGPSPAWASSDAGIATVDGTGLATGVGTGITTISATAAGVSGTAELTVVSGLAIGAGFSHSCSVRESGAAYCWGSNINGQLGNGTLLTSAVPVRVAGGHTFTQVSGGFSHTCALGVAGAAYCWGANFASQLGRGFTGGVGAIPAPVVGGHVFASVEAANGNSCGITTSGAAYCWGANQIGQLGDGSTTASSAPVAVAGGHTFASVTAGNNFACGISTGGTTYCWGNNQFGMLGNGTVSPSLIPSPVSGGHSFLAISGNFGHVCGLTTSGAAYCWGTGFSGQLGDGSFGVRLAPVPVSGGLSFSQIATGGGSTCGVTTTGAAYCWGFNGTGALGNGSVASSSVPVPVSGGLSFASVSVGVNYACGITTGGLTYCWGDGAAGQLGMGFFGHSTTPVAVVALP